MKTQSNRKSAQTQKRWLNHLATALFAGLCAGWTFGTYAINCNPYGAACLDMIAAPTSDCPAPGVPSDGATSANGGSVSSPYEAPAASLCPTCASVGSAIYWVSHPDLNLRIEDLVLSYMPGRTSPVGQGSRIKFQLSYRQRGAMPESGAIFGLGPQWSCSFRAYLIDLTSEQVGFRLHRGGAGAIDYQVGVMQYWDGSLLSAVTGGYQIEYVDGSIDLFTTSFSDGQRLYYFLATHKDAAGNTTTYSYTGNETAIQLSSITDPDGRVSTMSYTNATYTNQITGVTDPFSRTAILQYDADGYLVSVTDSVGLQSSFAYDADLRRGWITNLTTAYGQTGFTHGGVDALNDTFTTTNNYPNRYLLVSLPGGGKELHLYRHDCTAFMNSTYSTVPSIYVLGNGTLDNVDQNYRNSFKWGPLQYAALSTSDVNSMTGSDYAKGQLYHWLQQPYGAEPSVSPSLQRLPSPDGTEVGQIVWFDYDGKSANNRVGTNAFPKLVAKVLPDGNTGFTHYSRNNRSQMTQGISTYTPPAGGVALRTNSYFYASNQLDLQRHIGPAGQQVVSNYFAAGNAIHAPDATYDALNQQTVYAYNSYGQATLISRPSGLTTTNVYGTSGDNLNRLILTIDLEINRTNSFTYYAHGLPLTHTDERGLATTRYWDNLGRQVAEVFPDATSRSNVYSKLDLAAAKDGLGNWSYYGRDSQRRLIAETNSDGVITRYGYCECGSLSALTNAWNTADQMVTQHGYDYQGNRIYTVFPDALVTNWFDSLRRVVATGDGWGYRWHSYNNQGLPTVVSNAYGAEQMTVYGVEDKPLYVTDANGVTVTNAFDDLGRLLSRSYPDGGVERFGYSARGLVAYTNQLTNVTYSAYDAAGRKTAETNANNEVVLYTNSPAGDLLSLTDGKSQTTLWKYSEYGLVTNKTDQAGMEILRYTYDAEGRLATRWSKAKGTTVYSYSPGGSLTNIDYPVTTDVRFTYDSLNRLKTMVDAAGTTVYGYSAGGQLWTEDGPFDSDTVTNTYQNRLRVALSLGQPTGTWTNAFGYDAAKRLTAVASPAGVFNYTLGGSSSGSPLPKKIALPNSAYITNTYNNVARLTGTWLKDSGHMALDSATYGCNVGGQRCSYTNDAGTTFHYAYDKIGQLKVADSSVDAEDTGYSFDAAWNLACRTNNGTPCHFSVESRNQLLTVPGGECTYDCNGNLLQVSAASLTDLNYDDENRLVEVCENASHTFRTVFTYDGQSRLRLRREYTWNGTDLEVSKSGMTLSGSGTCCGWDYPYAKNGLTADPGWHNASYSGTTEFLRVDLGSSRNVGHVAYEPRVMSSATEDGSWNGAFKEFAIYVTDDSTGNPANWGAPVATGEWFWPNLQARRDVYFTPKSGRYVYFRRTTAWGWYRTLGYPGFASANEIWVYEQSGGWELASETRYIYDGKRVIQERDGNNVPEVCYTRGTDLSGTLEEAGGIGGLLARSTLNPQLSTSFYHADGNGNVTALVDSNQELAASYRYDPFGNLISQSGALADANVYRFSSKELNISSGLYYYLYRFYSPSLQRWVNRDPLYEKGWEASRSRKSSTFLYEPDEAALIHRLAGLAGRQNIHARSLQLPPSTTGLLFGGLTSAQYGDQVNLWHLVGNNPVNIVDPLGLRKNYCADNPLYACACAVWAGLVVTAVADATGGRGGRSAATIYVSAFLWCCTGFPPPQMPDIPPNAPPWWPHPYPRP